MIEFSDLIEDMDFVDLQLVGGNYTWFKGDNNNVASRIDRILIFKEWDANFQQNSTMVLQRLCSNQSPIALQCGAWEQNKSYFKFDNWWLNTEGFVEKIKGWWESFVFTVSLIISLGV